MRGFFAQKLNYVRSSFKKWLSNYILKISYYNLPYGAALGYAFLVEGITCINKKFINQKIDIFIITKFSRTK